MNFTLHQLQIFKTVVDASSVSEAAQILHMTQPAVSIQLKNFQEQFDLPLTELVGRRIRITDLGYEVAEIAKDILDRAEAVEQRLAAYKGLLAGKLKFAAVSTGKYILPHFLGSFIKQHPQIILNIDVTYRSKVLELLQGNEIDFALVSVLPEDMDIDSESLMPNYLHLVAPGSYDVESNVSLNSNDISELPVIYREQGAGTRMVIESFFRDLPKPPRVKMELTSTEAVKQAVMAGLGVSVLSIYSMHYELQEGLIKILPAEGFPLQSEWKLIWMRRKPLSPVAKAYLNFLREHKAEIISDYFGWINSIRSDK
jgi:LysR family transcriptional regulator, low CO2-responsive transcriptional regulator